MTGYCADCGNTACICPVPPVTSEHGDVDILTDQIVTEASRWKSYDTTTTEGFRNRIRLLIDTELTGAREQVAAVTAERDHWKVWAETVEGLLAHRQMVHDIDAECPDCQTIIAIFESVEPLAAASVQPDCFDPAEPRLHFESAAAVIEYLVLDDDSAAGEPTAGAAEAADTRRERP